jgi:putative hydrolase of the HAD superfamily
MQNSPLSTQHGDGFSRISAVILDYGQVLVRRPTDEEFGLMAKMFNVSSQSFYKLWESSRGPYDRGDLTPEEYWLGLATQTNTSLDGKQIETLRKVEIEIWCHPYPAILDWVSQLRAAGIKTAVLSNMPWDLATHVRANFKWMEDFSFQTLSAEVRLIKPDPAIYEHTLRGLGVAAAESLFLDDREGNIRAASALGMHAIQFHSVAQLKRDLAASGFPILPPDGRAADSGDSSLHI